MKHANIALFVPHAGCPYACSFCDQRSITGQNSLPTGDTVRQTVKTALAQMGERAKTAQLAFFGGSFTAVPRAYMLELLEAAWEPVQAGKIASIRVSTRPDAINQEILALLKRYGVASIELGAQSMVDGVLRRNGRGHSAQDTRRAARLIQEAGFELGLQMMTGLPGDSDEGAVQTAKELIALKADTVRVYPTVVLKNTELSRQYHAGEYVPQTLKSAAALGGRLLLLFHKAGVPVIRMGLHSVDPAAFEAGPFHPAFRDLCEGEIYFSLARQILAKEKLTGEIELRVAPGAVSKMIGLKKRNLQALQDAGAFCTVRADSGLSSYEVTAKRRNGDAFKIH